MQKIKFDFEATKERIYAPNSNVPIGAPVDINGNIANDGNAYGIVLCKETENEKYWVKYNLVVMVAGYCDIIDAQDIWGDEYSAEAIAAMSNINFCYDHKIGGGGGWPADLPMPSAGGYGWEEEGKTSLIPETTFTADNYGQAGIVSDVDFAQLYETYTDQSVLKGKVNGVDCSVEMEYDYDGGYYSIYMFGDGTTGVALEQGEFDKAQYSATGLAEGETYTIEMFVDGSVVHTIDPKYLGGGGAMVVHFAFDPSAETGVSADKTVAETNQMLNNGAVGFVFTDVDSNTVYGNIGTMYVNGDPLLCAYCSVTSESINEANVNAIILSFDGDTWELA